MKKKIIAALLAATSLLIIGCGNTDNTNSPIITVEAEPIATEDATQEEEEVIGEETITEREIVDGKMQSYLTGEWKDAEVVQRRNMAVMMPNNKASLPQYGISQASIIYEAPVEGRITRLMAFYEDYDDLEYIGPVRSSRDYFLNDAMSYDSIYVNWGLAVPFVGPIINTDKVDNISQALTGIDVAAPEAFGRISRPGYAQEYTGYLFIDGYNDAMDRLGYRKEYTDSFDHAFIFAGDGHKAEYAEYPDATEIYPGGTGSNSGGYGNANPCFEYNEADGLYYRTQFGGKHVDEMNEEQLAVSNVIFKVCVGEVRQPTDLDYIYFGVHGVGDAYIFTNGKVVKGTWEHSGELTPNIFYDDNGEEIVLNQGKTWICIIWEDYEQYISYE